VHAQSLFDPQLGQHGERPREQVIGLVLEAHALGPDREDATARDPRMETTVRVSAGS
jgi:hypothetical protein